MWTRSRNLTSDALFCVLRLKLKAQVVIRAVHVRALKISIDATDVGGDLANAGAVIASRSEMLVSCLDQISCFSVISEAPRIAVIVISSARARHVHVPEGLLVVSGVTGFT